MENWIDLTAAFPKQFDVERLRAEYASLKTEKWLEHYDPTLSREWKAILLVSIDGKMLDAESQRGTDDYSRMKRTDMVQQLPYFEEILNSFQCRQGRVRILRLAPGAGINMHRDIRHEAANFALRKVRLHIPIHTNDGVIFHVGGEEIKMAPGRLYYVNFSKKHYVENNGSEDRIHLVLDLEVNDWLAAIFPKLSVIDKLQAILQRIALPIHWKLLKLKQDVFNFVWTRYENSRLRRLRHRFLPKSQ